jgi:hypothetical protein
MQQSDDDRWQPVVRQLAKSHRYGPGLPLSTTNFLSVDTIAAGSRRSENDLEPRFHAVAVEVDDNVAPVTALEVAHVAGSREAAAGKAGKRGALR